MSLWAAVPHYVQLAPSPPAAKALCERLGGVLGARSTSASSTRPRSEYVDQVSQAVATDADTATYVEELERRADSLDWLEESGDLPSGDALAAEITRFLREREANGDTPESGGPGLGGVFGGSVRRRSAIRSLRLRPRFALALLDSLRRRGLSAAATVLRFAPSSAATSAR